MRTPGYHIEIVYNLTFNLQTPIRVVGGVIFVLLFLYYTVACANIESLNLLDKLLTFTESIK